MKLKLKYLLFIGAGLLYLGIACNVSARIYVESENTKNVEGVAELAQHYLGSDYKYGGSSPTGFDCSGFALYIYKIKGITLPRSSQKQYAQLLAVRVPREGDLVFFRTYKNTVSHVGIYLGNFEFIHAPGKGKTVRIDDIRNPYWRKVYAGARSVQDKKS